jgi:hypothetical protein
MESVQFIACVGFMSFVESLGFLGFLKVLDLCRTPDEPVSLRKPSGSSSEVHQMPLSHTQTFIIITRMTAVSNIRAASSVDHLSTSRLTKERMVRLDLVEERSDSVARERAGRGYHSRVSFDQGESCSVSGKDERKDAEFIKCQLQLFRQTECTIHHESRSATEFKRLYP